MHSVVKNAFLAILCANFLYKPIEYLYVYFLAPRTLSKYRRIGAWAVLTGASDGIGFGFAQELASQGFNLVIHGRNPEKLAGIKTRLLEASPKIQIRIVTADATKAEGLEQTIEGIAADLANLPGPLTMLVNNVGGTPLQGFGSAALQDMSHADVDATIDINVRFGTQLTRALLPQLARDGPSIIISIGSISAFLGIPLLSVYSGCKAYLMAHSSALTRELDNGCEAMCVVAGTVTDSSGVKKPASLFTPSARTFAQNALARIGSGKSVVVANPAQALLLGVTRSLPDFMLTPMLRKEMAAMKADHDKES